MKITIETTDEVEAKRLLKASDMAYMLWELQHNFWRIWKHSEEGITLDSLKDELSSLFRSNNIDTEDLVGN